MNSLKIGIIGALILLPFFISIRSAVLPAPSFAALLALCCLLFSAFSYSLGLLPVACL